MSQYTVNVVDPKVMEYQPFVAAEPYWDKMLRQLEPVRDGRETQDMKSAELTVPEGQG